MLAKAPHSDVKNDIRRRHVCCVVHNIFFVLFLGALSWLLAVEQLVKGLISCFLLDAGLHPGRCRVEAFVQSTDCQKPRLSCVDELICSARHRLVAVTRSFAGQESA